MEHGSIIVQERLKGNIMKSICSLMILVALASCGASTDGDANTDTTQMNVDTSHFSDSSNHINTMHGTQPVDSTDNSRTLNTGDTSN
jgi:hypothetical protein